MNNRVSMSKPPLIFFVLVFVISIPFWLIGSVTEQFMPKEMPINLPFSSLAVFNPIIAALILTYREDRFDGVKKLLNRSFDYTRIREKTWYVPIFLLMPIIMILAYVLMHLMGVSIPDQQFPVLLVPVFFLMFFIAALSEEVGWQGYAIDPLQDRWNALGASIILGIVWAIWHIVPFIQAHHTPIWIASQCMGMVVTRILIVWLYNNTGKSVFSAILFHAMTNVSMFLFPNYGSSYDPFIAGIIMAVTAAIVIFLWGPLTLARYRYARLSDSMSRDRF